VTLEFFYLHTLDGTAYAGSGSPLLNRAVPDEQRRIQDLPKGEGTDHGEYAKREPKREFGGGAPAPSGV